MNKLEDAIILATTSHSGRKDKAGEPYILHLIRVMLKFSELPHRMVAVLHDIIEDTGVTVLDLVSWGYSMEVVTAIEAISRRKHEQYDAYLKRVKVNPLAFVVKVADIDDNLSPGRVASLPPDLGERYRRALAFLLQ